MHGAVGWPRQLHPGGGHGRAHGRLHAMVLLRGEGRQQGPEGLLPPGEHGEVQLDVR